MCPEYEYTKVSSSLFRLAEVALRIKTLFYLFRKNYDVQELKKRKNEGDGKKKRSWQGEIFVIIFLIYLLKKNTVTKNTKTLVVAINERSQNYVCVSIWWRKCKKKNHNFKIGNKCFENDENFKYLVTKITNQKVIHE